METGTSPHSQIDNENKLQEQFQTQLNTVLQQELTFDNIDVYVEDAVNNLVSFVGKVTKEYTQKHPGLTAKGKELEDIALKSYGLESIDSFLESASQKLESVMGAEDFIRKNIQYIDEVITPPDAASISTNSGEGTFEKPGVKNRLKTLLYILQNHGIDLNALQVFEGKVPAKMMRKLSYITVVISELNRIVQVCDEENNASYIFDTSGLEKLNVDVDGINRMTKDEKNELLSENPQIGQRFVEGPKWVAKLEGMLYEDFEQETGSVAVDLPKNQIEIPQVSTIELDPWKGFWTDKEGKHFGHQTSICSKLGCAARSLKRFDLSTVSVRELKDRAGWKNTAYSFEDIIGLPAVRKVLELPTVEKTGEWEKFWIDPETGHHFSSIDTLANKLNVHFKTIDRIVLKLGFLPKEVRKGFLPIDAYSYELIKESSFIQERDVAPRVEESGEWKGFYTDEEGYHWGSVYALSKKLSKEVTIDHKSVAKLIADNSNLSQKRISSKMVVDGYRYEDLVELPEFKKFIAAKDVEAEGEWKGFYVDHDTGDHWGTAPAIARKLDFDASKIQRIIKKKSLPSVSVRVMAGKKKTQVHDAYKFKDIIAEIAAERNKKSNT